LREDVPKDGKEDYDPDAVHEMLKQEDAYQLPLFGSLSLLLVALSCIQVSWTILCQLAHKRILWIGWLWSLDDHFGAICSQFAPKLLSEREFGWKKSIQHPLPLSMMDNPLDLGLKYTPTDFITFVLAALIVTFYF
jgi:hypothetical protein